MGRLCHDRFRPTVHHDQVEVGQIGVFRFDEVGELLHGEEEDVEALVQILESETCTAIGSG